MVPNCLCEMCNEDEETFGRIGEQHMSRTCYTNLFGDFGVIGMSLELVDHWTSLVLEMLHRVVTFRENMGLRYFVLEGTREVTSGKSFKQISFSFSSNIHSLRIV